MTLASAPCCLIHSIVHQLNKTLPLSILTPSWRARSLSRTHTEIHIGNTSRKTTLGVRDHFFITESSTVWHETAFMGSLNWSMLPNWGFNLHCTSSGKPLLDFPTSHPQPFSRPVNARDANYVIHLRGQQSTADIPLLLPLLLAP